MIKEALIKKVTSFCRQWMASREVDDLEGLLNEFFNSNVVIPKGENRHPYADVLHEIIEHGNGQRRQINGFNGFTNWEDCKFYPCFEFRIKPSEPVYEWQWKYKKADTGLWTYSPYMTDTEFDCFCYSSNNIATKDEETKRERK